MNFLSIKLDEWKKKAREAVNADNIIDLTVDILLLFLDVLTTPILLPIRIAKYYLKRAVGKYVKKQSKTMVKKVREE